MEEKLKQFNAQRMCLLGRSGVGKSYNGSRYIFELLKKGFISANRLIIFSATYRTDPSISELLSWCQNKNKRFLSDHCFEEINTALIAKIFENQKIIKQTKPEKLKNWLIYFDDQITSDLWKWTSKDKTLLSAFCVGRHYNLSLIVGTQRLLGVIAPNLREQFTDIAMFQLGNTAETLEMLKAYNEMRGIDVKKNVAQLFDCYNDAIQQCDNHGCLVIHVMVHHGKGRYERGLNSGWYYDIQGPIKD